MRKITLIVPLLIVLLFTIGSAYPSSAQSPDIFLKIESVDTSQFPTVTIRLSAWNADGLPLAHLEPELFFIQEDGGEPLKPASLEEISDAPLWVVLAIDVSGSMVGKPLTDAKVAAVRFLDHLSPGDHAALIAFSDPVDPDPASIDSNKEIVFSDDFTPLYDLIESLQTGGNTQLSNAALKSVRLFESAPEGHRAVLILTDGIEDTAAQTDPEATISLAQESDVPFFVVGVGNNLDLSYLQDLGYDTGGLFRAVPSSAELASLYGDMATLLKTQYELTYTSTLEADGSSHTLDIALKAEGDEAKASLDISPIKPEVEPDDSEVGQAPEETESPEVTAVVEPAEEETYPAPPPEDEPPNIQDETLAPETDNFLEYVGDNPWTLAVAAVVLVGGGWLLFRPRKPMPIPEVCAKCGYDMTGREGPCPQCGETRRLPKDKG